jgi:surface carbohydrate biosynthesis protein
VNIIKLDVYGLYEHKVRELDSLVILKLYLSKYNYNMKIRDIIFSYKEGKAKFYPKILLLPFLHNDVSKRYVANNPYNIINMHWEQVGSKNSQNFFVKNNLKTNNIKHISWSPFFTKLLINKSGIKRENIWEVGNPKADLLSDKFIKSYTQKNTVKKYLNISKDNEYIVFVMGFSNAFVTNQYIQQVENKGGYIGYRRFIEITKRSFYKSLEIIKSLAVKLKKENLIILLRPHPMTPVSLIKKIFKNYENVRVSRDFPLHEIIYHSQGIISFNSTSVADAHIFSKPIYLLRPYNISSNFDIELFNHFNKISNENDLYNSIIKNETQYDEKVMEKYIKRIYGSVEGNNTKKLAFNIQKLLDQNQCHNSKREIYLREHIKNYTSYSSQGILKQYFPNLLIKLNPNRFKELEGRLGDEYRKKEEISLLKKYSGIIKDLEE